MFVIKIIIFKFNPSREAILKIREIICTNFDAPYVSQKKIPIKVCDKWFRKLEIL